jgi:hypothetical protein
VVFLCLLAGVGEGMGWDDDSDIRVLVNAHHHFPIKHAL